MCWNFETSALTFFLVLSVSTAFFKRGLYNDKLLGIFVLSYGSMQLFEALMWLGQNPKLKTLNYIGSYLAGIVLHLHPILFLLGMYLDKKTYPNIEKNLTFKGLLFAATLLGLWAIYTNFNTPNSLFYTKPSTKCGNLFWQFPAKNYYHYPFILTMLIIVLLGSTDSFKIATISYFVIAALISLLIVQNFNKTNNVLSYGGSAGFGSYWCWFAALFAFILFFVNPYIQK